MYRLIHHCGLFTLVVGFSSLAFGDDVGQKQLQESLKVFALSQPWMPLDDQPLYVQSNRGLATFVSGWLSSSSRSKESRQQLADDFAELKRNRDQLVETATQIDEKRGQLYRQTMKVDVLRLFVELISQGKETFSSKATQLTEFYWSNAEGRSQSFQVVLPSNYSTEKKYPLFVQVFGSGSLLPNEKYSFIRVKPSGRGVWGYRSMSRYDVMQVIRRAKEALSVDEDRVYITGTSAGATGIMHTVALRQDQFAGAVPLVAFGNDLPLENFRNLPIRCEHGVNDWTSAIGNVRVQFQRLKKLGYADAQLNEHPTAGHGVRMPPPKTMEWLFNRQRDRRPKHITHRCEKPSDGKAYWISIDGFVDPHQLARIDAKADKDVIKIDAENVACFSIHRGTFAPPSSEKQLLVNGQAIQFKATDESKISFRLNNKWERINETKPPARRAYTAGAAGNLFQGEPLLVVYGTQGTAEENAFMKNAAGVLARSGGPDFRPAAVRFQIRSDIQLADFPVDKYNLLLIGNAETNAYIQQISDRLPFSIADDVLNVSDRAELALKSSVLGFNYFNPDHPQRLIYVVSPFLDPKQRLAFLKNPRRFLAGSEGFKLIDQPDLWVRGIDLRIQREMQFDVNWQFKSTSDLNRNLPKEFENRTHLALAHMKVMRQKSKVQYAFWWGPEDKGLFGGYDFNWLTTFEPNSYTTADYLVRHREVETMTAVIPGSEFLDIHKRWIGTRELITWPTVASKEIDPEKKYSIVIPMDMVPKLGIRRKTLGSVASGPNVMPADVVEEMFSE